MGVLKDVSGRLAAITFAALLASAPAEEALALSKQATDFLLSISIDPASENAKLADQDGTIKTEYSGDPVEYSLESLAIAKKTNGVKCFINTRAFIRSLKADFSRTKKNRARPPTLQLWLWDLLDGGRTKTVWEKISRERMTGISCPLLRCVDSLNLHVGDALKGSMRACRSSSPARPPSAAGLECKIDFVTPLPRERI